MKRIRCPQCDERITFEDEVYAPGRILVFECPSCRKQFKIRIPSTEDVLSSDDDKTENETPVAWLIVLENVFHLKQILPIYLGESRIGRWVKGTKVNVALKTVDPSVDTLHCRLQTKKDVNDNISCLLKDGPSGTGTSCNDYLLGPKETMKLSEGDIITIGATTIIFTFEQPDSYECE